MSNKIKLLNNTIIIFILAWSLLVLFVLGLIINENLNYADRFAIQEAETSIKKDLAYRSWVSSHGGVYVPITKHTPPNPYLSHVKNRDVTTNDNQKLTLMNPAYTLSHMMKEYSGLYGVKGHITSLQPLNPKNKADVWERKALEIIDMDKEKKSIYEKTYIHDKEYLRYMNPLITKPSCLKCHAFQGYKVGEVRGAVSVSIPMKPYIDEFRKLSIINIIIGFFAWIIGVFTIVYWGRKTQLLFNEKVKNYEQGVYSLVHMIEQRDRYTAGHSNRVAEYSVLIAKEMNLSHSDIDTLYRACMVHDIGKVAIPDIILLQPGTLDKREYEIIQSHVVVSYEILKDIDIYKNIAEIVRHHHEHYDGSGYPEGLKGDDIPILSQIMTVADAFDAMTTNRIYKGRKTVDSALEELKELAGKQFNAKIVEVAVVALKNINNDENINQRPITEIEKEKFSYFYKDQLTKTFNRDYLKVILYNNNKPDFNIEYIYGVYLHKFSKYNKENGWTMGDKLLAKFGTVLNNLSEDSCVIRMYGDDFLLLSPTQMNIQEVLPKLQKVVEGSVVEVTCKDLEFESLEEKTLEAIEKIF